MCALALVASRAAHEACAQCRCSERDGVQCSSVGCAGCRLGAGRIGGVSCASTGQVTGSPGQWSMVAGRSGTEGFGWRSQPTMPSGNPPIPCTCARCPGSDPRLPCWSSACLPSLSLPLPPCTFHHCITTPPVHPSTLPIQASEPNHNHSAHPTTPAPNHLSFASGIPVVTPRPRTLR